MLVWRAPKAGLDEGFVADLEAHFAGLPDTWYVLSGLRTMEEQAALWAKYQAGGPRAAPPGLSAHNWGLAVDVVLDLDPAKPGLQPSWDRRLPQWVRLKASILPHPRLSQGWRYGDWPHVERYNWKWWLKTQRGVVV